MHLVIRRAHWLRGLGDWLLSDRYGSYCAVGHYLHALHPEKSPDELLEVYESGDFGALSEIAECSELTDGEIEEELTYRFARDLGVDLSFEGESGIQFPNGHRINPRECGRIPCGECGCRASFCEYSRWAICTRPPSKGIAFWYYCSECWAKPGPTGTIPADRAMRAESEAA